ncbi:hypothetical protein DL766_008268 [Monosporascus sp. MC13-8B]|uniref:HTH OST-type domain-containing protein n=1 Tax=Monosporascus cannonballus TaxID=155416 RepID=A0ABY0H3X2_9PEZI|nr:hypothetical protein DL762_005783 [Monosporascus cannonballus]RYO85329.1 hypothetical protein DL763_007144 [Monosporascus cannonballus]RYP20132.1 hypothetical protein DL766_008268 [Monosporascus sp. MC13-8B]
MEGESTVKLAILIDADNAQASTVGFLLAEVAKYGTACVKRAYGDWTGTNLKGWKDQLLTKSIQPVQQFAYTHGKNATDAAMIIDAMDLLYSNRFDGFCLVSSDSDFTRLAVRIRESGLFVYGFGNRETPKPFVAACNRFLYVENLGYREEHSPRADKAVSHPERVSEAQSRIDSQLVIQLEKARHPDFDPRSYRHSKLSDMITATSLCEVTRRSPGKGKPQAVYVRAVRRAHATSAK